MSRIPKAKLNAAQVCCCHIVALLTTARILRFCAELLKVTPRKYGSIFDVHLETIAFSTKDVPPCKRFKSQRECVVVQN